jgi:hypothetical protein
MLNLTEEQKLDPEYLLRKENQEWELAGCARQDRDTKDELKHTELAREYHHLRYLLFH